MIVFINKVNISTISDFSNITFEESEIQLIKRSYIYIHYNGICFPSLFPLTYKVSDFINSFIPVTILYSRFHIQIFKNQYNVVIDCTTVKVYYRSKALDPDKSLSYYKIEEKDVLVLVDNHTNQLHSKSDPSASNPLYQIIQSLQDRIQVLEKEIEEKDNCISILSNQLTNSRWFIVVFSQTSIML